MILLLPTRDHHTYSIVYFFYIVIIDINTDDPVTDIGKAGAGYESYVARAKNSDVHARCCSLRFKPCHPDIAIPSIRHGATGASVFRGCVIGYAAK